MCVCGLNWDDVVAETEKEYHLICRAVDTAEATREGLTLKEFRSRVTPGAQKAWEELVATV